MLLVLLLRLPSLFGRPALALPACFLGAGEVKKRVAIVGKGLTFDSGGYNIKAGAGSMIEMMKFDM
jgi:leucyl aminopeptidase